MVPNYTFRLVSKEGQESIVQSVSEIHKSSAEMDDFRKWWPSFSGAGAVGRSSRQEQELLIIYDLTFLI